MHAVHCKHRRGEQTFHIPDESVESKGRRPFWHLGAIGRGLRQRASKQQAPYGLLVGLLLTKYPSRDVRDRRRPHSIVGSAGTDENLRRLARYGNDRICEVLVTHLHFPSRHLHRQIDALRSSFDREDDFPSVLACGKQLSERPWIDAAIDALRKMRPARNDAFAPKLGLPRSPILPPCAGAVLRAEIMKITDALPPWLGIPRP